MSENHRKMIWPKIIQSLFATENLVHKDRVIRIEKIGRVPFNDCFFTDYLPTTG